MRTAEFLGFLGRVSLFLVAGLLFIAPGVVQAEVEITNLGPLTYYRTPGNPTAYTTGFPGVPGEGTLLIENSGVTSAVIRLNGRQVASPNQFKQKVASLALSVQLLEDNMVEVELRGEPGASITARVAQVIAAEGAAVIGVAGGVVLVENEQSPLHGASLEIPAGGLSASTVVSLSIPDVLPTLPSSMEAVSPFAEASPAGLTFEAPATLWLPLLDPQDQRPVIVWNYEVATDEWSVLDFKTIEDNLVSALLPSLSIKVASSRQPSQLSSSADLAALLSPNVFVTGWGGDETGLRCDTLGPQGVNLIALNSGAILPTGALSVLDDETWLDSLAQTALTHLGAASDTRVFFWLNANEETGSLAASVLSAREVLAGEVIQLLSALESRQPGLTNMRGRMGLLFDIEPVFSAYVNSYADLLEVTRLELQANGLGDVALGVYPMKHRITGGRWDWYWNVQEFAKISDRADLLFYGAYDYSEYFCFVVNPVQSRCGYWSYSSRVASDISMLTRRGHASKLVVLLSTGDYTQSHGPSETFEKGVEGLRYAFSNSTAQLRGAGVFQLWGSAAGGSDPTPTQWDALRGAFSAPRSISYPDCGSSFPYAGGNYVLNPSFENDTGLSQYTPDFWWPYGAGEWLSGESRSGTRSLCMTTPSGPMGYSVPFWYFDGAIRESFPQGKAFKVSAWAKLLSGDAAAAFTIHATWPPEDGRSGYLRIFKDPPSPLGRSILPFELQPGTWTKIEATGEMPDDAAFLSVMLRADCGFPNPCTGPPALICFDDVSLVPVE